MMLLDGTKAAAQVRAELKERIAQLARPPGLGVIIVGNNAASRVYVDSKKKAAAELGIKSVEVPLAQSCSDIDVLQAISNLNEDPKIDGILLQLPLPSQIPERMMLDAIDPLKDVDGFSVLNQGKLFCGIDTVTPATPKGIIRLLHFYKISLSGKHAVVVGRSQIVGKPLAALLLAEDASVTICHSKSNLDILKYADIVVSAVGKPGIIKKSMLKQGVVVVDVGTTKVNGRIVGDVDSAVKEIASALSPVPGGVGPMTIAMVLENTVMLAEMHQNS